MSNTPRKFRLQSSGLINTPGFVAYARRAAKSDPAHAEVMVAEAFPQLPYLLVRDLLADRIPTRLEDGTATLVFEWAGPLAGAADYLPAHPAAALDDVATAPPAEPVTCHDCGESHDEEILGAQKRRSGTVIVCPLCAEFARSESAARGPSQEDRDDAAEEVACRARA